MIVVLCAVLAVVSLAAYGSDDSIESMSAPPSSASEEPSSVAESSEVETETQPLPSETEPAEVTEVVPAVPTVYMTTDISPERLIAIHEALNREATGNVAVKISTGEPGSHYLDANLIVDLV